MNEEITNAYFKIKFLELEVIQANAKEERVASKKLDEVLAHQKSFLTKATYDTPKKVAQMPMCPRR